MRSGIKPRPLLPIMPTFSPPFRHSYPRFHPRDTPAAKRVLSYYSSSPEGISVYVLVDGTVTQVRPPNDALIRFWYRGGYVHKVSDAEAAVLNGAGYVTALDPIGIIDYTPPPPVPITVPPAPIDPPPPPPPPPPPIDPPPPTSTTLRLWSDVSQELWSEIATHQWSELGQ